MRCQGGKASLFANPWAGKHSSELASPPLTLYLQAFLLCISGLRALAARDGGMCWAAVHGPQVMGVGAHVRVGGALKRTPRGRRGCGESESMRYQR